MFQDVFLPLLAVVAAVLGAPLAWKGFSILATFIRKRRLPVQCGTCENFDVAEAQRQFATNPAFLAASQILPPWQMGGPMREVEVEEFVRDEHDNIAFDENGDPKVHLVVRQERVPLDPAATREMRKYAWTDCGACYLHAEIRLPNDTCNHWKAKL